MFTKIKKTFKIVIILTIVLLVNFLIKPNVALAGNFSRTCTFIELEATNIDRSIMSAKCKRKDGSINESARFTLSNYVGNNNGDLYFTPNGNYQLTCLNPDLIAELGGGGLNLVAKCLKFDRSENFTKLNLDLLISNNNGILTFDGG